MRRSRGLKRGIAAELGCLERGDQPLPELLQRGQVDGDQALVGGAQDVGLRQTRAVGGGRRLAEREDRPRTVRRRNAPWPRASRPRRDSRGRCGRAAPALRGCPARRTAGDGIGQRRTQELRAPVIDHHAEKAARAPAPPSRSWGDRAYGPLEPKPLMEQYTRRGLSSCSRADTCAETLGRAGPEVLDVDVRLADQAGRTARSPPPASCPAPDCACCGCRPGSAASTGRPGKRGRDRRRGSRS